MRASSCKDPALRAASEGLIDPWLKTLSLWDDDHAVVALSCYATHPMSHYGAGMVSSDFFGLARARRQADDRRLSDHDQRLRRERRRGQVQRRLA